MDKEEAYCEECVHSRLILSENGWHAVCTLSKRGFLDCLVNGSKFLSSSLYLKFEEKKEGE